MGTKLLLGVRLTPQSFTTVQLDDVNLLNKVEQLKTEAALKVNLPKDSLGKMMTLLNSNYNVFPFRMIKIRFC